jgi:hypothetical protein
MSKAAETSAQIYTDYTSAGHRGEWASQIAIDRDYYLNKQWTEEEQDNLLARGQAPLVINRIFPVCQQKLAQLTSHKPVIRAVPIESGDNKKSHLWSMMIEYVLQNSDYELVDLEVKRNHIVSGVGYYYVYVDPYADDGKGELKVTSLPPDIVYVDPNSRKVDYSDANHILVSQIYTMTQAKQMWPDKKRSLGRAKNQMLEFEDYVGTTMSTGEGIITPGDMTAFSSTMQDDQDKVRIIERFSKVRVPYYIVVNPMLGFYDIMDQEKYDAGFRGDERYETTKIYRTHVERTVSAGNKTELHREVLPIEDFPIIPAPNVWVGTPYPLSDVRYLRGPQDEINKRRSLMILNASSMSSAKWLVEKGSIIEREWDQQSSLPGARLNYRAGFEKPTPVFPVPLPNALTQLETEAKHDVEYTSGIFGVSHGDPQGAPETYGATLALEEYANRRLAPSVEIFTHSKKVLGRVIINLCRDLYTVPKYIRVVGDEGLVTEVLINQPNAAKSGPHDFSDTVLDHARYDVVIQSGKFAPTNRIAHAQFMMNLYERKAIDNQALLEALDLPNKEDLIERLSVLNQQASQIQSQEEQIKDLEGLLQTLRRQLQQAGIKSVVDEYRNLEKAELLETKAQQKVGREAIDLDRAAVNLELQNIKRDFELDQREQAIKDRASNKDQGRKKEKSNAK